MILFWVDMVVLEFLEDTTFQIQRVREGFLKEKTTKLRHTG